MNQQIAGPASLLSSAWKLYKAHWKTLALIAILPTLCSYIGQLLAATHSVVPAIIGGLLTLVSAIFSIAMGSALVSAVHRLSTEPGTKLSVGSQYRIGFSFFWSVILIGIINGLVFFGSFFLLVIPAIIIGVYVCFYIFTLVIDGKRGFSALTESYSLVHGRWAAVFGRGIVLGLIILAAWLIMAGLGFILAHVFGLQVASVAQGAESTLSVGNIFIGFIISLFEAGVVVPFGLAYMYSLYSSLKATREAAVETGVFKKWLIAFISVGVIAVIVSFIGGIAILFNAVHKGLPSTSPSNQTASTTLPIEPE